MKIIKLFLVSTCLILMTAFSAASFATETSAQYVKGSAITADVKAKLLADSDIKSLHITVKTMGNKVILSGYVENNSQKSKAVSIASQVDGVKSVKDELIVQQSK